MSPSTQIAGKPIGPIGYGMMGMTFWKPMPFDEAVIPLKAALENGANLWNGATIYGPPNRHSLHLVKHYLDAHPQDAANIVLSIKGCYEGQTQTAKNEPAQIREEIDRCHAILDGTKTIDLFQCARQNPQIPIETQVKALAELIAEGKIGAYGLSECNEDTIRRAHAVHPVGAVEIELSIFSRHALAPGGIRDTCRELGIPLVAYSPLDRGWLTGQIKTLADVPPQFQQYPRFQSPAFEHNVKLAEAVAAVAKRRAATSPQVALAWVRAQGAIPIPGATSVNKIVDNCQAITLTEEELEELQEHINEMEVMGDRYPKAFLAGLNL